MKKLEICCYSVTDAVLAQQGGADRIELCSGRQDGGVTPSIGQLIETKKAVTLPIHTIIRPRGGDFCYNNSERRTMRSDIEQIKDLGVAGIVIGMLDKDGNIDIAALTTLLAVTKGLSVTFHRAFDMCRDPYLALKQLADLGINRILTSGQQPTAIQGLPLIIELCKQSQDVIIMPGANIRPDNIYLFDNPSIKEVHSSASKAAPSIMLYKNANVNMGHSKQDEYTNYFTDIAAVRSMKNQLAMFK